MKKILSGTLMTIAVSSVVLFPAVRSFAEETISNGIYADDISLGGMSREEAEDAIDSHADEFASKTITLYAVGDNAVTVTPGELGYHWCNRGLVEEALQTGHEGNVVERYKSRKDLELNGETLKIEYSADDELVKDILEEKCAVFDEEPVNGSIRREGGEFIVSGGTAGAIVDIDSSAAKLEHFLSNEWDGNDASFNLTIKELAPNGTMEELSLVQDVLGSFHTSYKTSSASRSANIRNGASLINGSVIFPGEEFSFYNHVKPFTYDNGYQLAAAYSSGQVVDSVGGGICQVSSTLYNTVLLSELEVTERRNHGMIVTYVDPARDATIAESAGTDFRFVNNTDAPVYIDAYTTEDKQLYISIYGHETRPADRQLSYESEVVSKTVPENIVVIQDGGSPVGHISSQSAHIGYKANLWKVVTENGETTRELVNTSTYNPAPKYLTVGMATSDPNIYAAMEGAIASNNEDTIRATAANCKALSDAAAAAALAGVVPEAPAPEE